jgi:hypothetical protein
MQILLNPLPEYKKKSKFTDLSSIFENPALQLMHVLETSSLQQQGEQLTPAGVQAQQKKKKAYSF